jgi:hypothetical protein
MSERLIWLVDYDGKIENLALMRLSTWHKRQGDTVHLKHGDAWAELFEAPDRVYISCLFRWHKSDALRLATSWDGRSIIGGTGVDIAKKLPSEVAACPPDYTLYGKERAIGFISRGCIRKCPWCVVPRKEGRLRRASTAQEIVGDFEEALFLDNNFLALPDHHKDLEWLVERQIAIDFNQGLDARLVTKDNARLLAACNWLAGPRLALDSVSQIRAVNRALTILKDVGIPPGQIFLFILIGFDGLESDIERLRFAYKWYVAMFPMGYRDLDTGEEPARGWPRDLYYRYRKLMIRLPRSRSVFKDLERALGKRKRIVADTPLFADVAVREAI